MTDHNDTGATARPWVVPAGEGNEHVICAGDDAGKPGKIICILHPANFSYERLSYDELTAVAALIVEAVNEYEPLKARLAEVERERDDIRSTLNAWFNTSNKLEPDISKLLLDGLNGYIRRSESGGMPFELADDLRAVIEDFCRLYVGNLLTPYIERSKSEARALAASRPATQVVDREAVARLIVGPRLPVPSWSQFTLEQLQKVRWDSTPTAEQKDALNAADAILSLFRPAKAWDSATSPGMTDLMISPESLDAVGEPVAWRIRVRNGPHTYNEYTERLPFEPLVGSPVKVLGEPEPLYTHPPKSPDTSAEEMREALLDATANLVGAASAYRKHAARHRSIGRAIADPFFTTQAAIRQLPTESKS